jgi:hypothetical protein
MEGSYALEALSQKVTDLQYQLNERELEVQSLRAEIAELREATSTLSIWMEKLAEILERQGTMP